MSWSKDCKYRNLMLLTLVGTILLSAGLFIADYKDAKSTTKGVQRNDYGKGQRTEEIAVTIPKENVEGIVEITVGERQYTSEQMNQTFERVIRKMELLVLKENASMDEIRSDMNLMTGIPGESVEISWEADRYDVMNIYGELQPETIEKVEQNEGRGILVNLRAAITYTEDRKRQTMHQFPIRIYAPKQSTEEAMIASVKREIAESEIKTKTKDRLKFPNEIDGKKIEYGLPMNMRGLLVLGLGLVVLVLLFCLEKQNQRKEMQKRKDQMMLDYPEIINKLNLLLGAGITVKSAWRRIVTDYERKKEILGSRYAYEEMGTAYREMQSGVSEAESYERFGRRCNMQAYLKLGALLSQNVRKGTKGLSELLRLESIHAFEERKSLAKRLGEEAGTKLLLPMFFMLGIVLVIVIVPAFLSIQL